MKITFDSKKSLKNTLERGLPFERAEDFDWDNATFREDSRKLYPERRFVALGYLDGRIHSLCFTPISGGVRVISFRKASYKEMEDYEEEIADR